MGARFFPNPYADITDPTQPLAVDPNRASEFALECLKMCVSNITPSARNLDGFLYTGYIGIAWAALYALKLKSLSAQSREYLLTSARQYIDSALNHVNRQNHTADKTTRLSMLLGEPGVWITASVLFQHTNELEKRNQFLKAYGDLAPHFTSPIIFNHGSDEFFVGRAGYLAGLAFLRQHTGEQITSDTVLHSICDAIVQSGSDYARKRGSRCPLMFAYYNTEYLGAAHGLVGILYGLMLYPNYMRANPKAEQIIRQSVDYLIQITPPSTGNLPAATDELGHATRSEDMLVHWCHGSAGAIMLYARAFMLWKDSRYLTECRRCADVIWSRGLLRKGPGICHGVAGSGYAFLLMYRLTGEPLYLHRAAQFAHFMHSEQFQQARRPDCPFSLFEGLAGTACFYADLAHPQTAAFPFMDPFMGCENMAKC